MRTRSYLITGKTPLRGEVRVPGAKNAATKELVAALLVHESVTLLNVPKIVTSRLRWGCFRRSAHA